MHKPITVADAQAALTAPAATPIDRISENELIARSTLSRTTLYRLRKAGLPCARIGRRVLYSPAEVAAWIAQHGAEAA